MSSRPPSGGDEGKSGEGKAMSATVTMPCLLKSGVRKWDNRYVVSVVNGVCVCVCVCGCVLFMNLTLVSR